MLAYAAHRRSHRHLSPPVLLSIVAVHAAAITILALAKTEIIRIPPVITQVIPVTPEQDPPPEIKPAPQPRPEPRPQPRPIDEHVSRPDPLIPTNSDPQPFDAGESKPNDGPVIGTGTAVLPPQPFVPPLPIAKPTAPVLLTSGDQLRPPYPEEKRRLEEEAVLRLRLAIDARGRVTAVDPVGPADPLFLASARSHLLRAWRYRPATEAGEPVATSITVTLRFRLDQE